MAHDQATELRRIVQQVQHGKREETGTAEQQPMRRSARVIAITSGKGGVGKTSVSVNLATHLVQMKRKVALLDADMGMANADILCHVTTRQTLAHVVTGRKELKEVMVDTPGGFTLIPGASGLSQIANLSEFERARLISLFRQLESSYDVLLVDTGAGIGPNVMSFLLAADELLVLTTPEPTAMTDAYALIKAVSRQRESVKINLLCNMVANRAEAKRVYDRIHSVCRRFLGLCLNEAGYVVSDQAVTTAVRKRLPFVLDTPDGSASQCVKQLAHRLDREAVEPMPNSFFRRMTSWLAG